MSASIQTSFLDVQLREGLALASHSDILELFPEAEDHPRRFVARFCCRGLVRDSDSGRIGLADEFRVGVAFPGDYLECFDQTRIVTLLSPDDVWHPNIAGPRVSLRRIAPGTPLTSLLSEVHQLLTWSQWDSRDALNPLAAEWIRNRPPAFEFPLDRRPLLRSQRPAAAAPNFSAGRRHPSL